MDKKRIITSKYFRMWDITNKKTYLQAAILDRISFHYKRTQANKLARNVVFHLRERMFKGKKSYLMSLKCGEELSIVCGNCKDPRIFVSFQSIATFFVDEILQVDIANIMAMEPSDIAVIEVLAQVKVTITDKDIENILQSMDEEDG